MNNLDKNYQALLKDILDNGIIKEDRTGTGTLSVFGRQIRHKMSEGFPLLTTKKMAVKSMITELKWFLKGDTNIKYLVDNGCHIWDGDAYKNYEKWFWDNVPPKADTSGKLSPEQFINEIKTNDKFAKQWGELGPIYGKQWRSWSRNATRDEKIVEPGVYTKKIDQIQNLINDLKTNPDSRRLMVNALNVGELDQMVLPPCHYGFQVYTKEMTLEERLEWNYENTDPLSRSMDYFPAHLDSMGVPKRKISLMWNQRSCDLFLGIPFNVASYGMLLLILANEVNMVPDELIGNLGDTHLYLNHLTQAKEQIKREPFSLPKMEIKNCDIQTGEFSYELLHYHSHPTIKAPLSN
jgi:thymidylate synthase